MAEGRTWLTYIGRYTVSIVAGSAIVLSMVFPCSLDSGLFHV